MIYALLLLFFLSSCSTKTTIVQLDDFKQERLPKSLLPPQPHQLQNPKYRVWTDSQEIAKLLHNISNVEVVPNREDSEIALYLHLETKHFRNRTISIGKIEVVNRVTGSTIYIPIPNQKLNRAKLATLFPTRGYVVEKRKSRDGDYLFRVNIGLSDGISEGDKLNIYSWKLHKDFFSQQEKPILQKIGIGVVSQFVDRDSSWIYLENDEVGEKIEFGSVVKVRKKDFSNYLEDGKLFLKMDRELLDNSIR
ncbi:MAG TPA: hypothetical protein EYG60_04045 [Campylobacterales bacterium]|nr:hypothetical protein [Campylobacterales bacterium]